MMKNNISSQENGKTARTSTQQFACTYIYEFEGIRARK